MMISDNLLINHQLLLLCLIYWAHLLVVRATYIESNKTPAGYEIVFVCKCKHIVADREVHSLLHELAYWLFTYVNVPDNSILASINITMTKTINI